MDLKRFMRKTLFPFLQPFLAVTVGLTLGLSFCLLAGESPFLVLKVLCFSAVGSPYDFGMTLFYTAPLMLTGLSVAFAFQGGLFNIGAEGQLLLGAFAAAAFGILFPQIPKPWSFLLGTGAAFLAGAIWGAIPGWLLAKRGSHEVITTIMLNFIAAALTSWLTLYVFKNPATQNPETLAVGSSYLFKNFQYFEQAPVNMSFFLPILGAVFVNIFLWKTVFGYKIRAVGSQQSVARAGGMGIATVQIWTMAISGGIAGLVGVVEVFGNSGRFKMEFSPGYGFVGIAVALLGRGKPLGIFFAALLFGILHKGTLDLDFETAHITRDLSLVFQALVILAVGAERVWEWMRSDSA